jgi:hypothetical protein
MSIEICEADYYNNFIFGIITDSKFVFPRKEIYEIDKNANIIFSSLNKKWFVIEISKDKYMPKIETLLGEYEYSDNSEWSD